MFGMAGLSGLGLYNCYVAQSQSALLNQCSQPQQTESLRTLADMQARWAAEDAKYARQRLMARILDKDRNMSTRLERRRAAIQAKWRTRAKVFAIVMVSLPVSIAGLALLWRVAILAIVL